MRTNRLMGLLAVLALVIAACGGSEADQSDTTASDDGATTTETAPTTTIADDEPSSDMEGVHASETELGEILVGPEGFTLYVFTNDSDGESVCYDGCAELWPPVPADTPIGSGLDAAMFGSTTRDDGSEQLTVNGMPLYLYEPDTEPGDTQGQGFNDVWFVVDTEGNMIGAPEAGSDSDATASDMEGVHASETELGEVLVGPEGFTLYVFTNDSDGESVCYDSCAQAWPPVPADTPIGSGLDAAMFGSTTRDDGSEQLTVNGMPVYWFQSDLEAGETNGQGVNGVWFVIDPAGQMMESAEAGSDDTGRDDSVDYGY